MTNKEQTLSDKRKEFIKSFINKHKGEQVFFTRNVVGDHLRLMLEFDTIKCEYCEHYDYWEIFGLTEKEYKMFILDGSNNIIDTIAGEELK